MSKVDRSEHWRTKVWRRERDSNCWYRYPYCLARSPRRRILRKLTHLRTGPTAISQISALCGYGDKNAFTSCADVVSRLCPGTYAAGGKPWGAIRPLPNRPVHEFALDMVWGHIFQPCCLASPSEPHLRS